VPFPSGYRAIFREAVRSTDTSTTPGLIETLRSVCTREADCDLNISTTLKQSSRAELPKHYESSKKNGFVNFKGIEKISEVPVIVGLFH
jgi:hypothetical protein